MKATILFVMLALLVSVGVAQDIPVKVTALRGLTSGTVFSGKAYIDSQSDTSAALTLRNFRDTYINYTGLDSSGAVVVWYRPLISGTTYGAKVTIGTVGANTNNSGVTESFAIPATCQTRPSVQFGVTFAASGNGTSSATYTLSLLSK